MTVTIDRMIVTIKNQSIVGHINIRQWVEMRSDGVYSLEIDSAEDKTKNQLAYYFGALIPVIMDWTGHSKDETDMHMRIEFLEVELIKHKDKEYQYVPSIKDLSKKKMSEFIDNVYRFCVTHELNPPTI